MKENELPKGYNSWLQFLIANREIIKEYSRLKHYNPEFRPIPGWTKANLPVETVRIDIDFAKARAFEELTEQIPDENAIQYALYCLNAYPTNPPCADLSAIKNMLINLYKAIY